MKTISKVGKALKIAVALFSFRAIFKTEKKAESKPATSSPMKTSLAHLTEEKQDELKAVVRLTLEQFPEGVEMIILFGSYARGDQVEELGPDGFYFTYQSDFDILVITDTKERAKQHHKWDRLEDRFYRSPGVRTPVTLIYHHMDYVNTNLSVGHYFFKDILNEGTLLYDTKRFELAEPRILRPEEYKQQAEEYFEEWYESANEFLIDYQACLERGNYKKAAFELHQAVECYYAAILLVFTLYKPKIHHIDKLGRQAAGHNPELLTIFPKGTEEERHRFKLLQKAYIEARYKKKSFNITREELEWLAERVKILRELTEKICKKKIESIVSHEIVGGINSQQTNFGEEHKVVI
jgi:HEPN domain-containing protein/predicted nucleotidyltransferase